MCNSKMAGLPEFRLHSLFNQPENSQFEIAQIAPNPTLQPHWTSDELLTPLRII